MSDYTLGTSAYLFNAAGNPVGMLGRDGREWLFPSAITPLGNGGADMRQCAVLFDRVTGAPVGYLTPGGQEFLFPTPLTFNNATRGLDVRPAIETMLGAAPRGIGGTGGGWSWPASLIGPGGAASTVTPQITAHRITGVAPLAVTFDSLLTTSTQTALPFHEVWHQWDFGDTAGGATWAHGTRPGVASKNIAYGPVAAHVFETPGTYTVTLTTHDGTSANSTTATITVQDPATAIGSASTIYISQNTTPVPGANGVPAGANVQQVANWGTIQTLANTYKRILLKRGDVWDVTGGIFMNNVAGPGIIGAYGSGNKPRANINADTGLITVAGATTSDWRFVDLWLSGINLTSRPNAQSFVAFNGASEILLLRCDIENGRTSVQVEESTGLTIADCTIGGVSPFTTGYSLYVGSTPRVTCLGSRFFGSTTHVARVQGTNKAVFSHCTYDSPIPGDVPSPGKVLTLRGMSNSANIGIWNGLWTENWVISDCRIEGNANSLSVLRIHPQNDNDAERIRNGIVERNHITGVSDVGSFSVATGFTVRNNLFRTNYDAVLEVRGQSVVGSPPPS